MPILKITNKKVKKLNPEKIGKEKQIQTLFENNLDETLDIYFLASEYVTSFGGRIDTLGIDKNGAPVIIEYKRNQNDNVINQGLSYLRWLMDHKADFEKLVSEKLSKIYNSPLVTYNGELKTSDFIDWDSPRVICIAERFNKFDIDTADFLPIKIELLRYKLYEDDILYIGDESYQKIKISMSGITKKSSQQKETVLQKNYTLEDHLSNVTPEITSLFHELREMILALDENIKEEPKKLYIAYKLASNFVDVEIRSKDIKLFLNIKSGQLNDLNNIARDLTKPKPIGHWGNGDYELKFDNKTDIDKVFELIKQSYSYNK